MFIRKGEEDPAVLLECDMCATVFWVDPCGEENLAFNGKELIPSCPGCGNMDSDWGKNEK